MTDPIRLPLAYNLSPRSSTADKDALVSNVFYDKNTKGDVFAVKRPGTLLRTSFATSSMGIFSYSGTLFIFTNSATNPTQEAE